MGAIRNALGRTRSKVVGAVRATGQGIGWGFGGAWRGIRTGAGRVGSVFDRPRGRIAGLVERVRERPRYSIAIVAGILIAVAWIAWAIYVTANNGAAAGLGVLLSWPVLLGALALIAAPFVLTATLVQRHRASTPAVAGAPAVPEAEEEQTEESEPEEDPAASSA